jgi:hypothetical protein
MHLPYRRAITAHIGEDILLSVCVWGGDFDRWRTRQEAKGINMYGEKLEGPAAEFRRKKLANQAKYDEMGKALPCRFTPARACLRLRLRLRLLASACAYCVQLRERVHHELVVCGWY